MKTMCSNGMGGLLAIGLQPGDMLLESIIKAVEENEIKNGVVVSGVGTLKTCRMHYITACDFPGRDEFYTLEKPLELLSLSGIIADGKPHLHITVSYGEHEVFGGHLEEGSEVMYLAEIAILLCNDLKMARSDKNQWGVKLLMPQTPG